MPDRSDKCVGGQHWQTVEFIFEKSIKTIFKIRVICCFIGIDLSVYSKKAPYLDSY